MHIFGLEEETGTLEESPVACGGHVISVHPEVRIAPPAPEVQGKYAYH